MKETRHPHPHIDPRRPRRSPLELSITEAASALGVTRQALSASINGRGGVSDPDSIRTYLTVVGSYEGVRHVHVEKFLFPEIWRA